VGDPLGGPRLKILSARLDRTDADVAAAAILAPNDLDRARVVCLVGAECLVLAAFDWDQAALLARADVILADGASVRLAARVLAAGPERAARSADLLPRLLGGAAGKGLPVVLVGGAPGDGRRVAEELVARHAGLSIPLVSEGEIGEAASRELAEEIRALGPCLVLVGMSSPRQERWVWAHLEDLREATVVMLGSLPGPGPERQGWASWPPLRRVGSGALLIVMALAERLRERPGPCLGTG